MAGADGFRRKVLRGLVALATDEARQLGKFRRTNSALTWIAAFVCVGVGFAAWQSWPSMLLALAAFAAGLMIGLSFLFDSAIRQWPVVGPLIDRERLRAAAEAAGVSSKG